MAKTKDKKDQIYIQYKDKLSNHQTYVLIDTTSIKTHSVEVFKQKLAESNATYFLIKNTLFRKALAETKAPLNIDSLTGVTGAVFASDSSPALKTILEFLTANPNAKIKVGIVDGAEYNAEEIIEIGKLPSKEELVVKLLGTLKAPLYNTVGVLSAVPKKFLYTLKAIEATK